MEEHISIPVHILFAFFLFQVRSTTLKLLTRGFSLPRVCPMILDPSCTIKLMHSRTMDGQPSSQWIPAFLSTLLGSVMDFHEGIFSMSMHFIAAEVSISAIARKQLMPEHSMRIVSVLERTSANSALLQLKMITSHIGSETNMTRLFLGLCCWA